MYVVRMIEVATSMCDALRGVLIELDKAGIFKDAAWRKITAPDDEFWLEDMKHEPAICWWPDTTGDKT